MNNMNGSDLDQDNLCISNFVKGDSSAFEPLVKKYWNQVYFLCLKYLKNPELAADAAQETFITAFAKIENFIVGRPFRPWLLKIAVNKSLRLIKKNQSQQAVEAAAEVKSDFKSDPAGVFASKQMFDECINRLEFEEQILFVLRHGLDLAYDEIAVILEKPVGSVKGELFRARKKLKEILEQPQGKEVEADA